MWLDDDDLLYADDSTGRWNLWRMRLDAGLDHEDLAPADADTGGPLWVLGARWYAPAGRRTHRGDPHRRPRRDRRDRSGERCGDAHSPLDVCAGVTIEDVSGTRVLLTGASHEAPAGLWLVDVDRPAEAERVAGGAPPAGPEWMPQPRAVVYDGPHGPVHAFDYPPRNPHASAPDGELPPYVLLVHGGPTSHVAGAASARVAFFTSRGIGVLDVNYGGSSGYGREYRERLRGQWGVVDVDDVAAAAAGLIAEGRADPARLTIAGGSAGGWTVLAALVQTDVFAAGISRYGVGDARALAADTHDFESHYLDGLIGPLPDAEGVYLERSPLSHAERFRVPILLLQGADDLVVPPSQSEAIRDALRARRRAARVCALRGRGTRLPPRRDARRRPGEGAGVPRRGVRLRHAWRAAARAGLAVADPERFEVGGEPRRHERVERGALRFVGLRHDVAGLVRRGDEIAAVVRHERLHLDRRAAAAPPRSPRAARRRPRPCARRRTARAARGRAAASGCRRRPGRPC